MEKHHGRAQDGDGDGGPCDTHEQDKILTVEQLRAFAFDELLPQFEMLLQKELGTKHANIL